jgi:hypothetical protein
MIDDLPSYADPLPTYLCSHEVSFQSSYVVQRSAIRVKGNNEAALPTKPLSPMLLKIQKRPLFRRLIIAQEFVRCFVAVHGSWKSGRGAQKGRVVEVNERARSILK